MTLQLLLQPSLMKITGPYKVDEAKMYMKSDTASGYPWNASPLIIDGKAVPFKKKHVALDSPTIFDKVAGELHRRLDGFDQSLWDPKTILRFNVWNISTKHEVLPKAKNMGREIDGISIPPSVRTITYASFPLGSAEARFLGPIESAYQLASGKIPQLGSMIGVSPLYGGMMRIIAQRPRTSDGRSFVISTSDLSNYDLTQDIRLLAAEHSMLRNSLDGENPQYIEAVEYIHHMLEHSVIYLPNGQVFQKRGTQNSGARDTSGGNTRRRFIAIAYAYFKIFPSHEPSKFLENVRCYLMGDDELLYIHPDIAEDFSVDRRAEVLFEAFGFQTKTNERDSVSFNGHSFVGCIFKEVKTSHGLAVLPCFKASKVMAAACCPLNNETLEEKYMRFCSLAVLSVWPDEEPNPGALHSFLRSYACNLAYQNNLVVPLFPTYDELVALWTGHEGDFSSEVPLFKVNGVTPVNLESFLGVNPEYETCVYSRLTRQSAGAPVNAPSLRLWHGFVLFLVLSVLLFSLPVGLASQPGTLQCMDPLRASLRMPQGGTIFEAMAAPILVAPSFEAGDLEHNGRRSDNVDANEKLLKRETPNTTKCGRDWLQAALDPFHDRVNECEGYPDAKGGSSIQLCVKRSITLGKPAGLPSGSTWDMHIFTTGLVQTERAINAGVITSANNACPVVVPGVLPVNKPQMGTYTIVRVPSGLPTCPSTDPGTSADLASALTFVDGLSPVESEYSSGFAEAIDTTFDGRARLDYCGCEIVNVTPALYKGGTCTSYSQMGGTDDTQRIFARTAGFNQTSAYQAYTMTAPPSTLAKCVLLQDARQWSASEGAYLVSRFATADLPADSPHPGSYLLMGGDLSPGFQDTPITNAWEPTFSAGRFIKTAQLMGGGIYLTGLHETTVITVNARFGVEMFPTERNEIAMLASRPSAPFDPNVLQLYQSMVSKMPSAVRLADNATGDWFGDVVKGIGGVVGKLAPTALRAVAALVPHPAAKLAATAGASVIESFTKKGKEKERIILPVPRAPRAPKKMVEVIEPVRPAKAQRKRFTLKRRK